MTTTTATPKTLRNGARIAWIDRKGQKMAFYAPDDAGFGPDQYIELEVVPQNEEARGFFSVLKGGVINHNLDAFQMESVALGMLLLLGKE